MTGAAVNVLVRPYLVLGSFVLLCILVFAGAVAIIALLTLSKWMGHKARVRQGTDQGLQAGASTGRPPVPAQRPGAM
jgi:hypothetical protein